jgi:UDP-N-acetyl-D-mannosaminuronate dehydrogenase
VIVIRESPATSKRLKQEKEAMDVKAETNEKPKARTLVVGIGEVGGALAAVLDRKESVLRHDLDRVKIEDPIGTMHICIPFQTPHQFETVALGYISRFQPALTIINSTVVPGTTRSIAEKSGGAVAYSPVRGKHVRMEQDLLHYCKFVAAPNRADAASAEAHFQSAGMKTRRMTEVESLELAKLAETTYFGTCIAFAQEMNRYAERVGGDYSESIDFFEEVDFLPRQRYFPGFIGGHCVIPNIKLLLQIAPSPTLEAILDSNERRAIELESREGPTAKAVSNSRGHEPAKVLADRQ